MVFTRQAVDSIYDRSGGIPRLISVICDNALISGFAADRRPVGRDLVEDVCRDFDLNGRASAPGVKPAGTGVALKSAPTGVAGPPARPSAPGRTTSGTPAEKPKEPSTARSLFEHFTIRRRFPLF